ncbi:MAG: DinB family protein [Cyclobacteriaceae bacterium]|nr:DinB family protein [Cyclobacteriaceae bacterium]
MYRKIEDFIADWKAEESATIKIFESIPDNAKATKASEHLRSLERLAWHITQTLTEMPARAGIIAHDALEHEPIPDSFNDIILAYKNYSGELMAQLQNKWTDDGLTEKIKMYGEQWERRKILSVMVLHQVHHRGQMTALMRVLNLKVPGIYGPSKEEWGKYGMPAME